MSLISRLPTTQITIATEKTYPPCSLDSLLQASFPFYFFVLQLMKIQKSLPLFLLVIIMLPLMQGSSSHYIHQASSQEKEQSSRLKYSSMFSGSYSAILASVESRKNKISSIHVVSRRLVPEGPNPLHN